MAITLYNVVFYWCSNLKLHFSDRLTVFFSHFKTSDRVSDFVFLVALTLTHRTLQVRSGWGGGGCVSTLVTGPSGLPPGCAFTWTLPPERTSASQTHLASLAGPAVILQPDPMIHSMGEISHYPTHSQSAAYVTALYPTARQKDLALHWRLKHCKKRS